MLTGQLIAGRFEIEAAIGSGGMGVVYRALDRHTGRAVAIKLMNNLDRGNIERFERESTIAQNLEHPQVVRYISHGTTDDGRRFLALEWLEGETLAERLLRGPLGFSETLRLAVGLCQGLAAAHEHGIVHRDVKPANIFLVAGLVDRVKILDFGVARSEYEQQSLTRAGSVIGTPGYMAPEQARGELAVDARADLFSLGCVLFECLAGSPPFVARHIVAVLAKILFEQAPRVSTLRLGVPSALDTLVDHLLAKARHDRPQSADEVLHLLRSIVMDEDVQELPRMLRPTAYPQEITVREQTLLAVVVLGRKKVRGAPREQEATIVGEYSASPAEEELAAIAESFGGVLSPVVDGSTLVVFSAAGVATDLAVRAARCALALRVHRPQVAVAVAVGRGVASSRLPVGEVIDRAAALIARGDSSKIRVDDLTAGLLDARFDVAGDEVGLCLEGERERDATRFLLGKPSKFVGRNRELRMLQATFDECVEDSVSRGVWVTGDAGLGKSRLRQELVRWLHNEHPSCEIWIGRGDPLAVGATYGALSRALRGAMGVSEGEPLAVRQRKVRARISLHVPAADVDRLTWFIAEFVGAAFAPEVAVQVRAAHDDPALFGDQLRRAFEDFVVAEARARPLVFVLEDMQWCDLTTFRLLLSMLSHAKDQSVMLLGLGRVDPKQLFSGINIPSGITQLALAELSPKAATELATNALAGSTSPERIEEIVRFSSGNPFYLEELLRHVHSGAESLPPTLIAMAQGRLEALPPEARRLLRAASVFGLRFWLSAVRTLVGGARRTSVMDDSLPLLLSEELIEKKSVSRFDGEEEYVFRQEILRDAAYATFTDADLSVAHRLAGSWLEEHGEHDPLVLAEHFSRGGALARAGQELVRAAEQAMVGDDVSRALALVQRARDAAQGAPGTSQELLAQIALVQATALRWRGDFAEAERSAETAATLYMPGTLGWFHAIEESITSAARRGVNDRAIDWYSCANCVASEGTQTARTLALCAAGRALFHAGGYELADELIDRLRTEREQSSEELEPRATAEFHRLLGARARHLGDAAEDLAQYSLALVAYDRAGDTRNGCNARVSVAFSMLEVGAVEEAKEHLERALVLAERLGLGSVSARARQNLGLVLYRQSRFEEACATLVPVIEESQRANNVRFEGWTRVYLARALHGAGDYAAARTEATRAVALLELTPPARAGAYASLALTCIAEGAVQEAESYVLLALTVLDAFGGIEEFESLVWLASIESALACGNQLLADERVQRAKARLSARAAAIGDAQRREGFLQGVPENAALFARISNN